jgi:glycosyltransferase involved in cell wall biosynthesis
LRAFFGAPKKPWGQTGDELKFVPLSPALGTLATHVTLGCNQGLTLAHSDVSPSRVTTPEATEGSEKITQGCNHEGDRFTRATIVSNFSLLGELCREGGKDHLLINDGILPWRLLWLARNADAVVLDNGYRYMMTFCFFKMLSPWRFKLVLADFNLYAPETLASKAAAALKRIALKGVDRFAQLFKDTRGYHRLFGIDPARNRYLPFKVNGWEAGLDKYVADPCTGSYVICVGRTYRDHQTYIEAMRLCGLPGVLLVPPGGPEASYDLPPNLKLEIHSDGKSETFINWIKGAAVVVIPRFANAISPNGISTYLTAMGASRCVVVSRGPGVEDLLRGEAIPVCPEQPMCLAEAVESAWEDLELRRSVAQKGRQYAEKMQGERRYMSGLMQIVTDELS